MGGWEEVSVRGFAELERVAGEKQRLGRRVFVFFSGDKDASGASWCPDCVTAEPVVRAELPHLPEGSVFVYCQVGSREQWKDPENEFRRRLRLSAVPTLLQYGSPQKLVEQECFKSELVRLLFEED